MADPALRIRASGYGGSGYFNPFDGKKSVGVTTALGAMDKPGVRQWAVDQTAAYAVANLELLANRDIERGFKMLRWYHSRAKESEFDDPEVDIHDYHTGVLNDLAELGTLTHEWIEAHLAETFEPDLVRDEQAAMIEAYLDWYDSVEIEPTAIEATVFGYAGNLPYGGTADLFARVDGVDMLIDVKTSRMIYDSHVAQLAAYGAGQFMALEVPSSTEGATEYKGRWFVERNLPPVEAYGVLQVRPDDYDSEGNFIPAFCELHYISQAEIEAGWRMFEGALLVREGQKMYKDAKKAANG